MFRRKLKLKFEFSLPIRHKDDESYDDLNSITICCKKPDGEIMWIDCGEIKRKNGYPTINSFYDWDQLCSLCVAGFLQVEPTKKYIKNLQASRFIHKTGEWKKIKIFSDKVNCCIAQHFIIVHNNKQYNFWLEPSKYMVLMCREGWDWLERVIWTDPLNTMNPLNHLG